MGLILGILTTPGRAALLGQLLVQIEAQQWDGRRLLVVDDDTPIAIPPGWDFSVAPKTSRGNWAPFRHMLELARGQELLALEDDVQLGGHGLEFIRRHGVPPDLAFVSFFECCFVQGARLGLYTAPCEAFGFAQALLIPARTIELLLTGQWDHPDACSDSNMSTILRGQRYGIHVPSVVQHVGRQSIISPDRQFFPRSNTYLGDGYRYLDLLPSAKP